MGSSFLGPQRPALRGLADTPIAGYRDPWHERTTPKSPAQFAPSLPPLPLPQVPVRALDAVCPHRGGPLADGHADASVVVCPLHTYAFRLDDSSCTSDGIGKIRTYPAEVVEDSIAIRLS